MKRLFWSLVVFSITIAHAVAGKDSWRVIAPGTYLGYADMFAIIKGSYILDNGCVSTGGECELTVSQEGISFNTWFYKWDAPGFQASRTTEEGEYERINILGKIGQITVVDLITEKPKGKKVSLIRMAVAPKK